MIFSGNAFCFDWWNWLKCWQNKDALGLDKYCDYSHFCGDINFVFFALEYHPLQFKYWKSVLISKCVFKILNFLIVCKEHKNDRRGWDWTWIEPCITFEQHLYHTKTCDGTVHHILPWSGELQDCLDGG